jgi:hypothetical protein
MNNEFAPILGNEMKNCIGCKNYDPLDKVQNQVEELTGIIKNNVDSLFERGKRLDDVTKQAQDLEDSVRETNSLKINHNLIIVF